MDGERLAQSSGGLPGRYPATRHGLHERCVARCPATNESCNSRAASISLRQPSGLDTGVYTPILCAYTRMAGHLEHPRRQVAPPSTRCHARLVARAGISPDDLLIQLSETPGENSSFGQGLAQRAYVSAGTVADGDVPVATAPVNGKEHDWFERYRHQRRQRDEFSSCEE
jgi:hypothetical protein